MSNIPGAVNKQYLIDQLKNQYGEDLGLQTHVNLTTVAEMIEDAPETESDRLESEWIGYKFDIDDPYPILIKSDYLVCKNCSNYHFLRIPIFDKMRACTAFDIPLKVPKYCSGCGWQMRNAT